MGRMDFGAREAFQKRLTRIHTTKRSGNNARSTRALNELEGTSCGTASGGFSSYWESSCVPLSQSASFLRFSTNIGSIFHQKPFLGYENKSFFFRSVFITVTELAGLISTEKFNSLFFLNS